MINFTSKRTVRWVIGVAAIIFWPVASWSSEDHQPPPTLTVSAEGKVQLPPDKALIGLAVETAGESLADVQEDNRKKMRQILDRLQKLGIQERQIQTSSLQVTPHYPPRPRRQISEPTIPEAPKIIGYTVKHSLTVVVQKLDSIGRIVDAALKAGANRFSQITWALNDKEPAQLEAIKVASKKAREKANTLAKALSVELVRLLEVSEGRTPVLPRRPTLAGARMSMAMAESDDVPLSPGELNIQATVNLVFEIRDK